MSANSIALFKNYIDQLDDVYKAGSKTSILDSDSSVVKMGANAGEFLIPKMSLDGLGNYSRSNGYVAGGVSLTFETKQADYDRGRSFNVDAMDNEETAGIAFGTLASEFIRTKTTPEIDAYRFAKYAAKAGTSVSANISTGNEALAALVTALTDMQESEVDDVGNYLFITPTLYNLVKAVDTYKSKEVLSTFTQIVDVPQSRFYTAINLYDGTTTGETEGGFAKASSGKNINFMIVNKKAVLQFTKHTVNKIVSPEENQTADAWKFFFRVYSIADIYENKSKGVYLHSAAGESGN